MTSHAAWAAVFGAPISSSWRYSISTLPKEKESDSTGSLSPFEEPDHWMLSTRTFSNF